MKMGGKTISQRTITVGTMALADASKLDRTDYAIIFTTDNYDNWPDLTNPVNDGRMIADELKKNYGFKVETLEGGSQSDILKKLREYAEKKYKPLDQLFIFFAGHGQYDETFGEGFVVTKESLANDVAKTTYLSHNRLRSIINNIRQNTYSSSWTYASAVHSMRLLHIVVCLKMLHIRKPHRRKW